VTLVADSSLNTLLHLRYNPRHIAGRGLHGEGSNRSGRDGADRVVRVPVGTQILTPLLVSCCMTWLMMALNGRRPVAERGGFGNAHFTFTNRAPHAITRQVARRRTRLQLNSSCWRPWSGWFSQCG
jgi:GTP-binding protein